jgi:hypothetical protein
VIVCSEKLITVFQQEFHEAFPFLKIEFPLISPHRIFADSVSTPIGVKENILFVINADYHNTSEPYELLKIDDIYIGRKKPDLSVERGLPVPLKTRACSLP